MVTACYEIRQGLPEVTLDPAHSVPPPSPEGRASRRTCVLPKEGKKLGGRRGTEEGSEYLSYVFPKEAARGEAFRRKPPEVKLPEGSEGRPSFGRKPTDVLFSKQVHQSARGEAFRRKPPEVKLPEGRSETS